MKIEICGKCPIYNDGLVQIGIRKTIHGSPRFVENANAPKALLIAEAFGQDEDAANKPLIGRAGKVLDALLEDSGLNKFNLKLDNAVKCRPIKVENGKYKNRTPTDEEIQCCNPYMDETLSFNPDLIILLGRTPFKAFFPDKSPTECRGKGMKYSFAGREITTLLTYHPAATLYDPTTKPVLFKHLKNSAEYLRGIAINND